MAQPFIQAGLVGEAAFLSALRAGTQAIMQHGGAEVGSRTMVDALVPACRGDSIKYVQAGSGYGAEWAKEWWRWQRVHPLRVARVMQRCRAALQRASCTGNKT